MRLLQGPTINRDVLTAMVDDGDGKAWTIAEVADWLGLDRIQATNAVRRLWRNGMVRRDTDADGRVTWRAIVRP